VWSLGLWPVEVSVAGTIAEVPALPAIEWLVYLLQPIPDLDGLLTNLLPEVEDAIYENLATTADMYLLILDIIATVSAHPWWVTMRLISMAHSSWGILGPELMFHGVEADRVSLAAWIDAVLILILRNMDPNKITMFTMQLEIAPKEVFGRDLGEEEPQLEISREAFLNMG
jgi:hypothetical protein